MAKKSIIPNIPINSNHRCFVVSYNYSGSKSNPAQIIRWFTPDFKFAIDNGEMFKTLPPELEIKAEIFIEIYRLLNVYPADKKRRKSFTRHRENIFNIESLLSDPLFNDKLVVNHTTMGEKEIKCFIGSLSKKEKDKIVEQINKHKINKLYIANSDMRELTLSAFFTPIASHGLSRMTLEYYFEETIRNALKIIHDRFSSRDYEIDPITISDTRYIKENIIPDKFIDEIRTEEMSFILKKIEKLYQKLAMKGRTPKEKYAFNQLRFLDAGSSLREVLKKILEKTRSEEKRLKISELISFIEMMLSLPPENAWKGLVLIRDKFWKKDRFMIHFARHLENHVRKYFRYYSKAIYSDLCKTHTLSPAEKRLFLITNCGLPSLHNLHPLIDQGMKQFFKLDRYLLNLFVDVVLLKTTISGKIDLKFLLEFKWIVFMRIYAMLHEDLIGGSKYVSIYKSDQHSIEMDISTIAEGESRDFEEIDGEVVDKNTKFAFESYIESEMMDSEGVLKSLSSREAKIVYEHFILDIPQKTIAAEQNVTPQMISKICRKALNKLRKEFS